MLGLKLNHVSKRGHRGREVDHPSVSLLCADSDFHSDNVAWFQRFWELCFFFFQEVITQEFFGQSLYESTWTISIGSTRNSFLQKWFNISQFKPGLSQGQRLINVVFSRPLNIIIFFCNSAQLAWNSWHFRTSSRGTKREYRHTKLSYSKS